MAQVSRLDAVGGETAESAGATVLRMSSGVVPDPVCSIITGGYCDILEISDSPTGRTSTPSTTRSVSFVARAAASHGFQKTGLLARALASVSLLARVSPAALQQLRGPPPSLYWIVLPSLPHSTFAESEALC